MLTSLFSLFYVTGEFQLEVLTPRQSRKIFRKKNQICQKIFARMSVNLCMCNRKATSNNPALALVHSIPSSVYISPSGKGTPPVRGHLPLVPRVFAYGRFYCIKP